MKLFEKGKSRIGLDILDLAYIRGIHPDNLIKSTMRKFANQGFSFVRLFNAHKDYMLYDDYNQEHWALLEKRLSYLFDEVTGEQMFIPIIDFTGYSRLSLNKITNTQWKLIAGKVTALMNNCFDNNWIMSLGNEIKLAPKSFKYTSKKSGLPGQMERLGAWANDMTKHLISLGVNPENIMVNTIEDLKYPEKGHPSTGDMLIGEDNSGIGAGGIVTVPKVINAVHKIHTVKDIILALSRMFTARRLWKYISTNDGNPASGIESDGVDPSAKQNGNFRNSGNIQNQTVVEKLCQYCKKGVGKILGSFGSYKIALWITDLFRNHYSHNIKYKCLDCGKNNDIYLRISEPRLKKCKFCGGGLKFLKAEVITDWNYIDFDRSELMAQGVIKVYGLKGLPNRGKFPPIKKERIKAKPIEETKEIIIKKEVIMPKLTFKEKIKKFWNGNKKKPLFWFHVTAYSLAFKESLEIIFWK